MNLLQALSAAWYAEHHPAALLLAPLGAVYGAVMSLRARCYAGGLLASHRMGVPVVVVGNLTVGGTGKTPLTLWLVDLLARHGWHPGIALRGYGAVPRNGLRRVMPGDDADRVGDEALLLAQRSGRPVVAAPDRVRAARCLVDECGCDIVVCDDGLQHLRLHRDVEIVVIDGERRFGNGRCLPAGPLREPLSRLSTVALQVVNGLPASAVETPMHIAPGHLVALDDAHSTRPLSAFAGESVHAVAGIGNPQRFFALLAEQGLMVTPHVFPDHHRFTADELRFGDDRPLLMTEKDAVKCRPFARAGDWFLPVSATLPETFGPRFISLVEGAGHGPQAA